MVDVTDVVANMALGDLPLSIATSIAIESACGILKDKDSNGNSIPTAPKKPPLEQVDELWINVRTLFRNIYGAIDSDIKDNLLPDVLLQTLIAEMRMIPNVIQQVVKKPIKIKYYVNTYKNIGKVFPNGIIRTVTSDKQKEYWQLEQHVVYYFINSEFPVEKFDVKITGNHGNAFIITHLAVDLLWRYQFAKLELLESHTGKIKPFTEWNTKLSGGKEHPHLPFNRFTLQVFGDGNNFFTPVNIKMKRALIDLSKEKNWTPVTSKEKIVYDLKTMKDFPLRDYFLGLYEE